MTHRPPPAVFAGKSIRPRRHLVNLDVAVRTFWGVALHYPPDKGCYDIPLSCLASRDTPNLFAAGRLADGDRKAGAAIRVLGTSMATGHAAGCAAALCARGEAGADAVRALLLRQGAILSPEDTRPA